MSAAWALALAFLTPGGFVLASLFRAASDADDRDEIEFNKRTINPSGILEEYVVERHDEEEREHAS
jgi:hypothetical protein